MYYMLRKFRIKTYFEKNAQPVEAGITLFRIPRESPATGLIRAQQKSFLAHPSPFSSEGNQSMLRYNNHPGFTV